MYLCQHFADAYIFRKNSMACYSKPNLDCNYHFPIALASIGVPIEAKAIGKG